MPEFVFSADAFGDRFTLSQLSLPRKAQGYALQILDTDKLFDQNSGDFLPIRTTTLNALFSSFDAAYQAAALWVGKHGENSADHRIAIVPAGYDEILQRHVLIYGVLCSAP